MAATHPVSLTLGTSSTEIDVWDRYTVSLSMLRAGQTEIQTAFLRGYILDWILPH